MSDVCAESCRHFAKEGLTIRITPSARAEVDPDQFDQLNWIAAGNDPKLPVATPLRVLPANDGAPGIAVTVNVPPAAKLAFPACTAAVHIAESAV